MKDYKLWIHLTTFLIIAKMVVTKTHIPTTLEGPFEPVTCRFNSLVTTSSFVSYFFLAFDGNPCNISHFVN